MTQSFSSILFPKAEDYAEPAEAPAFFQDLRLDQIVHSIALGWNQYNLVPFFYAPLHDLDSIASRQEVMRDLENDPIMQAIDRFSQQMLAMRQYTEHAGKSYYPHEKQRWFVDAVDLYCTAVKRLTDDLMQFAPQSRGLKAFREFLSRYIQTPIFVRRAAESAKLVSDLSSIRYSLVINEGKYTVRRFNNEPDYSEIIEATFEKFRHGAVRNYLAQIPPRTGMNHIQANVVKGISQLYPEIFAALATFSVDHAGYLDATIVRFDREIHFYAAYLEYMKKIRRAGLSFCYPQLSQTTKVISVRNAFDLALAGKLADEKSPIITNDFFLEGPERIFVVSGPNQGGKTTFARTFGQLHYLASLGCPVPGAEGRLFLPDQIFTHFEKEEDIANLRGKLHDDLVRVHKILSAATPNSIIIMNELFASTTLKDAVFLSKRVMEHVSELDLLGVWVTFLTEMASFNEKTVSVVSTVSDKDPAIRTFKLERRAAVDLVYALSVADRHGVTYAKIKERISA